MKEGERSFKIVSLNSRRAKKSKEGGRYISRSSQGAAKKAFNRSCRESKIRGQCTLIIVIQETTQGSQGKLYKYKMKRVKLQKPVIVEKDGRKIRIKYKTTATRL